MSQVRARLMYQSGKTERRMVEGSADSVIVPEKSPDGSLGPVVVTRHFKPVSQDRDGTIVYVETGIYAER